MLFNSYIFIFLFLPAVLLGFYLIGGRGHHRVAISWLVGCSLFFYGWWNPAYLGLILASILFNYAFGLMVASESTPRRKAVLTVGVSANLGLLGYYKYSNFFVDNLNLALGSSFHLETVILPLAISFFTFQQIAYLVDAYRGETREYNFLHYCLFVTFFPQLIAGPIVHHREMLPQFARDVIYRVNHQNLVIGLAIFTIGLFKKVVLADGVAVFANPVFSAAEAGISLSLFEAWGGALAYNMQIYFDFSGYSDMAIGLGRMFGIRLPLNFHSPYKARNMIEFWHRWHMTLSRFLAEYLYIPLGGNRNGAVQRYRNLFLTMLLGGLWHGSGWSYLYWGAVHGTLLVVNHGWHAVRKAMGQDLNRTTRLGRGIAWVVTFITITITMVIFRSESVSSSFHYVSAMFGGNGLVFPAAVGEMLASLAPALESVGVVFGEHVPNELASWSTGYQYIVVLMFIALAMPNTQEIMRDFSPAFDTYRGKDAARFRSWPRFAISVRWALIISLLFTVAIGSLTRVSEFLYFQF